MPQDLKFYVRIEADDPETSTLAALSKVLKESGLAIAEQRRVLQYLLDRRQPVAQADKGTDTLIEGLSRLPGLRAAS